MTARVAVLVRGIAAHFDAADPEHAETVAAALAPCRALPKLAEATYLVGLKDLAGTLSTLLDIVPDRDPIAALEEYLERRAVELELEL